MKTTLVAACLALAVFACGETKAADVTAIWNSPSDIPVTAAGYDANGSSIDLRLSFMPEVATNLVVVNNTGSGFIEGTFRVCFKTVQVLKRA